MMLHSVKTRDRNYHGLKAGFTLFEVVIVIAILSALTAITIPAFFTLQQRIVLDGSANEIATVLRLAQNRTVASEDNSRYGVYFNNQTSPHQYILFKGATYATRDTAYDQTYLIDTAVEFSSISLSSGIETTFEKLTGVAEKTGSVAVRLKADNSQIKTVYVSSSGVIDFSAPSVASDNSRTKDSRHVHFDYSRIINTASETITLDFDNGAVVETFPISSYLSGGEISWSDVIEVGGVDQAVTVRTHRLNNPDTGFSVTRDRRYNTKALKVTISGDLSGNLINYSADGATTTSTSIYVSNRVWQ